MAVEELRIGPFVGGLNSFSDATSIADTEVTELVNFELDIDGSLVNRPPIASLSPDLPGATNFGINVLGFYEAGSGAKYLIASNRNNSTYYFDGTNWTLITNTFAATAMAQYRDEVWLVAPPGSSNPGGKWNIGSGFTADANMPKGGCIVAFKDRLWVGPGSTATSNGARLTLSNISAGAVSWPATPNYLQIGSGDGQNIVDLAVYFESIVIFKQSSTFRFSFGSDPSLGTITKVSDNIGAIAKGCFATYQNDLYVLFDNKVYSFTNYNYDQLNAKVPLKAGNPSAALAEQASISIWADRIFVQYYDKTYVYSLRTRTWSNWSSTSIDFMGRFWAIPGMQGDVPTAYTYRTAKTGFLGLYICKDVVGTAKETMQCTVRTKNYDYMTSAKFKRLVSWGADVISKVRITAKVTPVTYSRSVTWDELKTSSSGTGGRVFDRIRTNLINNPRPANTNWLINAGTGGTSTRTYSANGGPNNAPYVRQAWTVSPTGGNRRNNIDVLSPTDVITPGQQYVLSVWVRSSIARQIAANIDWCSTAGAFISAVTLSANVLANTWTQISVTGVAPAGATKFIGFAVIIGANPLPGETLDASSAVMELGSTMLTDFSGNSLDELGNPAQWTGAVDSSQSKITKYLTTTSGYTWGALKAAGYTWDRPLDFTVEMTDPVETYDQGTGRKFIKFLKSLRFRQISFRLSAQTDGDTTTAPVRIFNIATRVSEKQGVPRKIN